MTEHPQQIDPQRAVWQRRLLPLMSLKLVLGAGFFSVMSVLELRDLYARVKHDPLAVLRPKNLCG
jgi:hypothetical protein